MFYPTYTLLRIEKLEPDREYLSTYYGDYYIKVRNNPGRLGWFFRKKPYETEYVGHGYSWKYYPSMISVDFEDNRWLDRIVARSIDRDRIDKAIKAKGLRT